MNEYHPPSRGCKNEVFFCSPRVIMADMLRWVQPIACLGILATREKGKRSRGLLLSFFFSLFGRRVDWKRAKLPECHCPSSHSAPLHSIPFRPLPHPSRSKLRLKLCWLHRSKGDVEFCSLGQVITRGQWPYRPPATFITSKCHGWLMTNWYQ